MSEADPGLRPVESAQDKPRIYLFLGPEGAGKTIQAERLAEALDLPFFSTGNVLRAIRDNPEDQSERAQLVRKIFAERIYLDKDNLQAVMVDRLTQPDMDRGIVVDGMLRTMGEVEDFDNFLARISKGNAIINVISLRIPGWLGAERIAGRNRDSHDSSQETIDRMGRYYTDLGLRMSLVRRIVEASGGSFLIVDGKGRYDTNIREEDGERVNALIVMASIVEVHERIMEAINNG